jgi:hypothetical protein
MSTASETYSEKEKKSVTSNQLIARSRNRCELHGIASVACDF